MNSCEQDSRFVPTCVNGEDAWGEFVESDETGFDLAEFVQFDAVEAVGTFVTARVVLRVTKVELNGTLKNVNNYLNTNIYSYFETSVACIINILQS
jgi:hypothetical protein